MTRAALAALGAASLVLAAAPGRADRGGGERCNQAIPVDVLRAAGRLGDGDEGPGDHASPPPGAAPVTTPGGADDGDARAVEARIRWAPSSGGDCHRWHRRRVCEGPRKVPLAGGDAADRAARLGLGTRRLASQLLTGPADPRWVEEAAAADDGPSLAWPVPAGRLWRGFTPGRGRRRGHPGLDVGAGVGAVVRAARGGLVAYADNGVSGYGNLLIVVHGDGATTWYAHNERLLVAAGALVGRGDPVARVGDTGLAHGPHLHFEWRLDGDPGDPLPLLVAVPEGALPPGLAGATRGARARGSRDGT